jgi:hypothetical protein
MGDVEMVRHDEAMALLRSLEDGDAITKILVNNAMFHLLRRVNTRRELPVRDFDVMYFVELMREMFSEHDVLKRMLDGERVGAFFDDDSCE